MQLPRPCGLVTLLTDFGVRDPWVGVMKGVIKQHALQADVIDFCHGVPAHDVTVGAFFLGAAIERFPAGTVHVAVVDPGVGTDRRSIGHRRWHGQVADPHARREQRLPVRVRDDRVRIGLGRAVERATVEDDPVVRLVRDEEDPPPDPAARLVERAGQRLEVGKRVDAAARIVR